MKSIYLDYAAATPLNPEVKRAMEPYFSAEFYNPSATYLAAANVRKAIEHARAATAICLGAKPAEVVFTAGATEANNLAIQGVMRQFPDGEVLVGAIEHESVLEPAGLFQTKTIPVDQQGQIILDKSSISSRASTLSDLINDKTVLISIGYANNEIGTVQPLRSVAALINQKRQARKQRGIKLPLYFHTDAAQAPNYLDIHVSRLGIDLLSLNGGKIYGPKQSGALYVKAGVKLKPLILGGGQESGLRSGTENVAGIIGLVTALKLAQSQRKVETDRLGQLRQLFIEQTQKNLPNAIINGSAKHAAPHIISVTFPGQDNERLMMQLDEAGIQAATGSACAAANVEPSHVLKAIGLSDEQARSTLRFSTGRQTTKNDVQHVVKLLTNILAT